MADGMQTAEASANAIYDQDNQDNILTVNKWFTGLFIFQWLGGIILALVMPSQIPAEATAGLHPHVWQAVVLGGVIAIAPIVMMHLYPVRESTRHVVAISQMLASSLLIHVSGGRIETHFHIFASLAFLSFYRDWRVLITASAVVLGDLLVRGTFFPESIYGVQSGGIWRMLEHVWWVVFEDAFLICACLRMSDELKTVARQKSEVMRVVDGLSTGLEEILLSVTDTAAGTALTASAVNETTATIEELRQTSQMSSEKAKGVFESAQKSTEISSNGRNATDATAESMKRTRQQMDLIAESMKNLGEKARKVVDIIASVDDLSRQSNLLAVNAAIEAAKAGDQGRGFAVVAQQVKSMADQSKQSTGQVREILDEIQRAANSAATATELGSQTVDTAVKHSTQAGDSIATLAASVFDSATAAAQIASASNQQLDGVDQVLQAMMGIKEAATSNVDAINRVESVAHDLGALNSRLKILFRETSSRNADGNSSGTSGEVNAN